MPPQTDGPDPKLFQQKFETMDCGQLASLYQAAYALQNIFKQTPGKTPSIDLPSTPFEINLRLPYTIIPVVSLLRAVDTVLNKNPVEGDPALLKRVEQMNGDQTTVLVENTQLIAQSFGIESGGSPVDFLKREVGNLGLALVGMAQTYRIELPKEPDAAVLPPVQEEAPPVILEKRKNPRSPAKKRDHQTPVHLKIISIEELGKTHFQVEEKNVRGLQTEDQKVLVSLANALKEYQDGKRPVSSLNAEESRKVLATLLPEGVDISTLSLPDKKKYLMELRRRLAKKTRLPLFVRTIDDDVSITLGHNVVMVVGEPAVEELPVKPIQRLEPAAIPFQLSHQDHSVIVSGHTHPLSEKEFQVLQTIMQTGVAKKSIWSKDIQTIFNEVYGKPFRHATKHFRKVFENKLGEDFPFEIEVTTKRGLKFTLKSGIAVEYLAQEKKAETVVEHALRPDLIAFLDGGHVTIIMAGRAVPLNANEQRILKKFIIASRSGTYEIDMVELECELMPGKRARVKPELSVVLRQLEHKLKVRFNVDNVPEKGRYYSMASHEITVSRKKDKTILPINQRKLDALALLFDEFSEPNKIRFALGVLKDKSGSPSYMYSPFTAGSTLLKTINDLLEREAADRFSQMRGNEEELILPPLFQFLQKHQLSAALDEQAKKQRELYVRKRLQTPAVDIPEEVKRYRIDEASAAILTVAINHLDSATLSNFGLNKFTVSEVQQIVNPVEISLRAFKQGEHREFVSKRRPIALKKLREMVRTGNLENVFCYSESTEVATFLDHISHVTSEVVLDILIPLLEKLPIKDWEITVDPEGIIIGRTLESAAVEELTSVPVHTSVGQGQGIITFPAVTVLQSMPTSAPIPAPTIPIPTSTPPLPSSVPEAHTERNREIDSLMRTNHINIEDVVRIICKAIPEQKTISIGQLTPLLSDLGLNVLTARYVEQVLDRGDRRDKPQLTRGNVLFLVCFKKLTSQNTRLPKGFKKKLKKYVNEIVDSLNSK